MKTLLKMLAITMLALSLLANAGCWNQKGWEVSIRNDDFTGEVVVCTLHQEASKYDEFTLTLSLWLRHDRTLWEEWKVLSAPFTYIDTGDKGMGTTRIKFDDDPVTHARVWGYRHYEAMSIGNRVFNTPDAAEDDRHDENDATTERALSANRVMIEIDTLDRPAKGYTFSLTGFKAAYEECKKIMAGG